MALKLDPVRSGRYTYLYIRRSYRDKGKGSSRTPVEKLGRLDRLAEQYEDPVAHFQAVVDEMNRAEQDVENRRRLTVSVDLDEAISPEDGLMNIGYAAILRIYSELGLQAFFNNRQRGKGFKYNAGAIMLLLVCERILNPGSKKRAFENRGMYFERFDFGLHDVYRSLRFFAELETDTQLQIDRRIQGITGGRNTEMVYYDVTNYYFEIDDEDEHRRKGVSKEHRPNPIIQMGLVMDSDGLPVSYRLFDGNTNDVMTLRETVHDLKVKNGYGRVIVVADKGINSADNLYYLTTTGGRTGDGYVMSLSVRGANRRFKEYVLDGEGYRTIWRDGPDGVPEAEFMLKSRLEIREVSVTGVSGKKIKKQLHEKQVIIWSRKYAERAKAERAAAIAKAHEMITDPSKYSRATHYGATRYVDNISVDRKTGELLVNAGRQPVFNHGLLAEEEKYDGYYAVVTSEQDRDDQWIMDTYRGLWEIEETFMISKHVVETRPVYVSRWECIRAHFLSCFISMVVIRLLERKLGDGHTTEQILDCLKKMRCARMTDNLYMFFHSSDITKALGEALDVDFSRKHLRLSEIKHIIAAMR